MAVTDSSRAGERQHLGAPVEDSGLLEQVGGVILQGTCIGLRHPCLKCCPQLCRFMTECLDAG
ncbi:hypothetical protein RR42_s3421 [Cupriavidus basilensis]|uniref:Uncharacterized protein n=1 Tax=Cupriavidus basilensis TaxID=68895 RepID=A0A0C4YGK8_9BURK|nr:hypothetical protein RR42_s3421 [Cupriavidus basilensis]